MYNTELNAKMDETKTGRSIKDAFNRAEKCAKYLQQVATDAIKPDGEFTSPILAAFSEEEQTEMKAYITAIDSASQVFLDALALINNPNDTGA